MNAALYDKRYKIIPFDALRIIPFHDFTGLENMCIDYYLAGDYACENKPVLRFYGWQPWCLSLGKHQDAGDVNRMTLAEAGYDLVRRPTGGSAILHSEEITYSFIVPGKNLNHGALYQLFHELLGRALYELGYSVSLEAENSSYRINRGGDTFACFNRSAFSELQYEGRKVVGSAQKILSTALLQHGSILTGTAHLQIVDFLAAPETERRKYRRVLQNKSVSLGEIKTELPQPDKLTERMAAGFEKNAGLSTFFQPLSQAEKEASLKYCDMFKID